MASWVVPSWVDASRLARFAHNLQAVADSMPPERLIDGTITVSDTTDSKGQNVLRVAVTGRIVGTNHLAADRNPTYDA